MSGLGKMWSGISDSASVSLAKLNSSYKELDIAIVKATNNVESPPKEKHVRTIFAYTSATRARADVAYCIHALAKRLGKTSNWIVALKCLMVIHRTLREGDPTFREELINYSRDRGNVLHLVNFRDDSGASAWDYAGWVRSYALFLEERLEAFRILRYDVESERSSGHSKTRELDTPDLLEHLPALQSLLSRLMGCQPEGAAVGNHVIQAALGLVLKESFKLYRAINDGIINLVDKFFEMQKGDAAKALEIYKRAGTQAERLQEFYEICKSLDLSRSFQFPALEQPPQSFLTTMEEYVRDVRSSPLPPREVVAESYQEEPPRPVVPEPVHEPPPPPTPPVIEQDLLGLDSDPLPQPSSSMAQMEYDNSMALAIVPAGGANGNANPYAHNGVPDLPTTGWELALVSAPSATSTPPPSDGPGSNKKLAGGFDQLTLQSLYEDAMRRTTPPSSYGMPSQPPPGGMLALPGPAGYQPAPAYGMGGPPQDPFAASRVVAPPASVSIAHMEHQRNALFGPGGGMPGQQVQYGYGAPQQAYAQQPTYGMQPPGSYGMPPAQGGYGAPQANPFGGPQYGVPQMQPPQAAPPAGYNSNPFGNPNLL